MTNAIRKVATRMEHKPTINWITAHTGINGNEKADQTAKRGLVLETVDRTVPTSNSRKQRKIIETMRNLYNEETCRHASQTTINHRKLIQTVKTRKSLMNMQRKTQKIHMEAQDEKSYLFTDDNRPTTDMPMV